MATQTDIQLVLKLVDKATQGVDKVAKTVVRHAKGMRDAQVQGNDAVSQSYTRMGNHAVGEFRKLSSARETLGVRSERRVQQEIAQTQAAYQRLARSGTLSTRELIRAKQAEIAKVRELNAELGKGKKLNTALSVGAGIAAGGYVIGREASKAMSFDERLAKITNTAYPNQSLQNKNVGRKSFESAIDNSVRLNVGGGTRDQAAEALDVLVSGGGKVGNPMFAKSFLPIIMKTATANMADPADIARLAGTLFNQGMVKNAKELKVALNMIAAGDQAGGVGIKDLARGLPQQIGVGKSSGIVGLQGLKKLIVLNEAALLTSGNPDAAMNNVTNYLTKISSKDTAKDFEKAGRGDLAELLLKERAKGTDALTMWDKLIDAEVAQNPLGKKLLAQLRNAKSTQERQDAIEGVNQLLEGSVIGNYFQDMQARAALLATRNKDFMVTADATVTKNMREKGINDTNFAYMQTTASAQVRAAQQAKDAAVKNSMDNLTPTIGKLSAQFADLANKHPALAGAAVVATTAITAMAGAAGLATFALGGKGGKVPAVVSTLISKVPKRGFMRAGAFGLGSMAVGAGLDAAFGEDSLVARYGSAALNGAATGMLAGSVVPIIGNTVGGVVGGATGMILEYLNSQKQVPAEPAKMDAKLSVGLAPGLVLIGQSTKTSGNALSKVDVGSIMNGVL